MGDLTPIEWGRGQRGFQGSNLLNCQYLIVICSITGPKLRGERGEVKPKAQVYYVFFFGLP